ncbi:MAG TPA: RNA polymerase subunit sigma-70 [Desulfonauticus sp.]|jgi:RNA polymerase sigma-32 factor|nr:MAG: RNA polymerase sigma factor [Desulfonauticus sp. 38_4375]MDK2920615.1 polymerase sigma-32 factor [Desulfonauticus sp.]HCO11773.1 RNA polymerase subunit sigma-70 [Desulfonauticus sp.]
MPEKKQSPESKELALIEPTNTYPQIKDNLSLYLQEVNKFPVLSPEEEIELARRYKEYQDQDAAFKLITSNLRLVVKIAMDFQRRWMQNVLDLIQEGNIGLMKAVQKFDPDKGIKFSYYASFWIKAYILKFIMDNWRMVKIGTTQAQRKLFYNLNKEKQRLEAMGINPDAETISNNLQVSEADVIEMGKRMGQQDLSLDMPLNDDEEFTPLNVLPALEGSVEDKIFQEETVNLLREKLKTILPQLNDKEKDILELRLLNDSPLTLREIGEKYGITRERVRQIEARLLQKIKKLLEEEITDFSRDWILDE